MTTIVTHNSKFHADDVYAVACLKKLFSKRGEPAPEIIRSREGEVIESADIVVDVGRVFDPARRRFDHHQGGIEPRANGVPYASFGLVWREYGSELCGDPKIAKLVEEELVQAVDAGDEGVELAAPNEYGVRPYQLGDLIGSFVPTYMESELINDDQFAVVMEIAQRHLDRVMAQARAVEHSREEVAEAYEQAEDKRIIVLSHKMPWKRALLEYPEPRFVVYPVEGDGDTLNWYVQTVPQEPHSFTARQDLPAEWAGRDREELRELTGVEDFIFAHRGRFLAVAGSRESALRLAWQALEY